jgi:flagellar motility protein MotE (MotC chaperone)
MYRKKIVALIAILLFAKIAALSGFFFTSQKSDFSWDFFSEAIAQVTGDKKDDGKKNDINFEIIKTIEKKREELSSKEDQIKLKEERLKIIEQSIKDKVNELGQIKIDIDKLIVKKDELEEASIQHLAKIYKGMPPGNAAAQIEELDPAIAIKVFTRIKSKTASQIMPFLTPQTAKRLGEEIITKRLIAEEKPKKK